MIKFTINQCIKVISLFLIVISLSCSTVNTRYLSRHLNRHNTETPEVVLRKLIKDLGDSNKQGIIYIDTIISINRVLQMPENVSLHIFKDKYIDVNNVDSDYPIVYIKKPKR